MKRNRTVLERKQKVHFYQTPIRHQCCGTCNNLIHYYYNDNHRCRVLKCVIFRKYLGSVCDKWK